VVEDHVKTLASGEVREENVDRGGGALEARLTVFRAPWQEIRAAMLALVN